VAKGLIEWEIRNTSRGYEARLTWASPHNRAGELPGSVAMVGADPREAILRAATIASALAESPIAQAVMPPGTAAAITAIRRLASSKDLRRTASRFVGKGARRLARALGF